MTDTPFQRAYITGYNDALKGRKRSSVGSTAFIGVCHSLPDHAKTDVSVLKDIVRQYYAGFDSVDENVREAEQIKSAITCIKIER